MQIQSLDLDVNSHHRSLKYELQQAHQQQQQQQQQMNVHPHHLFPSEASAAEGLSQLLATSKSFEYPLQNPYHQSAAMSALQNISPQMPSPTMNGSSNANVGMSGSQGSFESALSPQKVRTERYVKVSCKGVIAARQKSLFLSWFMDNNGLPDGCLLLIPERHPSVIISFKGTHGWIEIDTNHCRAPDYEIQFELKLHHALLNRRRYVQNQPIILRFFLIDKREDGTITQLGEVLLSVLLMSSKCANRTLIAHLVRENDTKLRESLYSGIQQSSVAQASLAIPQMALPFPMDSRKLFEVQDVSEEQQQQHQHQHQHHHHLHLQNPQVYSQHN